MLIKLTKPGNRIYPNGEPFWINPECIAQMHTIYVEDGNRSGFRTVLSMTHGFGQVWAIETPETIEAMSAA